MKRYNKYLYILLFTFFLFSCTQDEVLNNGNNIPKQKENTETLYFNIAIPQMNTPKFRSNDNSRFKSLRSENNNEKKIDKVSILFFKNDTNKKKVWVVNDVNYNAADASYSLPFDNTIKQEIFAQESNPFIIYVLANWNGADFSDPSISNESDFLNMEISSDFNNNGTENQASFVMMARKELDLKISNTDLGEFPLSRLANKIVLKLQTGGEFDNASDVNIKCSLFNNNKKRKVGAGETPELFNNEDIDVSTTINLAAQTYQTTAKAFYSYPFNWENDLTKAPYFDIQISLKLNGDAKDLNYKVPITAEKSSLANHCYEVSVKLNKLAATPDVELTHENISYQIVPWTSEEINISIDETHYFVVTPLNSKILNKNSTTLYYSTSVNHSEVKVEGIKATYEKFNDQSGLMETVVDESNHNVVVTVNIDGSINVTSPIPTNNVPKEIYFTVSNGIPALNQKVYIRQTGATYITSFRGSKSLLNDDLPAHLKNRYMYFVRTVVPSADVILGYPAPIEYKQRTATNGWRLTINNVDFTDVEKEEIGNMISPAFVLASQLGATLREEWDTAHVRMSLYWEETVIGGANIKFSGFRLPTKSEINMMNTLQDSPTSIVKQVLSGLSYWTLVPYQREDIKNAPTDNAMPEGKAHIRLIKDIKGIQVDDI